MFQVEIAKKKAEGGSTTFPTREEAQKWASKHGIRITEAEDEEFGLFLAEMPEPHARKLQEDGHVTISDAEGFCHAEMWD